MKILMISDVYFPRINGVSTSIQTYRESLTRAGVHIDLIVPDYGQLTEDEENIHRIPARTVPLDPEDRFMRKKALYAKARELLDAERYDLIHVQTPFLAHYAGVKLAKLYNTPVVETYHTYFEEYLYNYIPFLPKRFLRALVRRFTRKQCNAMNSIIVPSSAMYEVLKQYGVNVQAEILPTGIKPEKFSHGDGSVFRKKYGIAPSVPVLVHVGRVCHEKNIDFLLHMHKQLMQNSPEAILLIAGEGSAQKHLTKLAKNLNIEKNVLFVGYLDRENELQDCYASGDVFVFSSRTETQGLVLLEAMAMGVPVVSTAVMGTKDILEPQKGSIIAEEEVGDFSQKVLSVISDSALKQRLSLEARQYAVQWSIENLTERMKQFYTGVVEQYQYPN